MLACLLGAATAAPALAGQATWSEADLESQLMCPVCHTLLDNSQSAEANRIREVIHQKHQQGWSEARTRDYLVTQYGEEVLAAPPYHGLSDGLIAPQNTINYYSEVARTLGGKQDDWMRVFFLPGVGHCGGGDGPTPPAQPDTDMDARIDAELAREEA